MRFEAKQLFLKKNSLAFVSNDIVEKTLKFGQKLRKSG